MTQEAKVIIGISVVSLLLLIGGVFLFSGKENADSSAKTLDTTLLVVNKRHLKGVES